MSTVAEFDRCEYQNGSKNVDNHYVINCSKRAKQENREHFYVASEMCNNKCPFFSKEIEEDYDWKDHWC